MVIKTYSKITLKMFKKHFSRMISIIFIVLISVAFISGLGSSKDKIYNSLNDYYKSQNVSDFIIKSTSITGFTSQEIENIKTKYPNNKVQALTTYDIEENEIISRLYFLDYENLQINKFKLLKGRYPTANDECMVERGTSNLLDYTLNDKITLQGRTYKVVGICLNPLILNTVEEIGSVGDKEVVLDRVVYFKDNAFLPKTDIWLSVEDRNLFNGFSSKYEDSINKQKLEIENDYEDSVVLTLYQNKGIYGLIAYADKVGTINYILMIAFIFVSMLIVLSTMSRLVEEERSQIACLTTLGYSPFKIVKKYVLFSIISMAIGSVLGYFVGEFVCKLIYDAFNARFFMPPMSNAISYKFFVLVVGLMALSLIIITSYVGLKTANEVPSKLLLPASPPNGKKVFLERIPFIWNRLSFKHKSSLRNVLRYKKHFFMTVISIAGATALVYMGIGVFDYSLQDKTIGEILTLLAWVVVVFAGLLSALVIYTLTNINISERNREIATLMVLGYKDDEVCMYIYREIYIMTFIGIILGIPLGVILMELVFSFLNFGSVSFIRLYVYFLTPIITIIFSILVSLILRKKILKIDMNESLKARE